MFVDVSRVRRALAFAALAAWLLWFAPSDATRGPAAAEDPRVAAVLAAWPARPLAGRLSGGFRFVACPGVEAGRCSAPPAPGSAAYATIARQLARGPGDDPPDAQRLHAEALALVVLGGEAELSQAAVTLGQAEALAPRDATIASDLAAVRLALADAAARRGEPGATAARSLEALEAALRAVRRVPEDRGAAFNLGLALERVGLPGAAAEAWRGLLAAAEGDEGDELRARIAAAEPAPRAVPAEPPPAAALPALQAWSSAHPELADRHGRRVLLPAWAHEVAAGRSGAAELAALRAVGEAAARAGDPMLAEVVAALVRAGGDGGELAVAHLRLARAIESVGRQEFAAAEPDLARAGAAFRRNGSPAAAWADYELAVCRYQHDDLAGAQDLLEGIAAADRYPHLQVTGLWLAMLVEERRGDLSASLQTGAQALRLLERLGDEEGAASMGLNLSLSLAALSRSGEAWAFRLDALRASAGSPTASSATTHSGRRAEPCSRPARTEAAMPFVEALVENADAWGDATAVIEARRRLAQVLTALGRPPRRCRRSRLARDSRPAPATSASGVCSKRTSSSSGARSRSTADPAAALARLDGALSTYRELGHLPQRIRLLRLRGQAAALLGHEEAAEQLLRRGGGRARARRGTAGPVRPSRPIWSRPNGPSTPWSTTALASEADVAGAFAAYERGRERADAVFSRCRGRGRSTWIRCGASYRGTWRWSLSPCCPSGWSPGASVPRGLLQSILEVSAAEAGRAGRSTPRRGCAGAGPLGAGLGDRSTLPGPAGAVRAGAGGSPTAGRGAGSRPPGRRLRGPRGRWGSLPRRAPRRPCGGTERVELRSPPSAPPAGRRPLDEVLALGDPAFDPDRFPALERLAGASREARRVAALYPRGEVLLGADASADALFAGLRHARVLHYAGHSIGDPTEPGSALARPRARAEAATAPWPAATSPIRPAQRSVSRSCRRVDRLPPRAAGSTPARGWSRC